MAEDSWENDVSKSNRKLNQKKQRSAKSALPVSKRPRLDTPDVGETSTDNSGNLFFLFCFVVVVVFQARTAIPSRKNKSSASLKTDWYGVVNLEVKSSLSKKH